MSSGLTTAWGVTVDPGSGSVTSLFEGVVVVPGNKEGSAADDSREAPRGDPAGSRGLISSGWTITLAVFSGAAVVPRGSEGGDDSTGGTTGDAAGLRGLVISVWTALWAVSSGTLRVLFAKAGEGDAGIVSKISTRGVEGV